MGVWKIGEKTRGKERERTEEGKIKGRKGEERRDENQTKEGIYLLTSLKKRRRRSERNRKTKVLERKGIRR